MFAINSRSIDAMALQSALGDRAAGALVTFEGWVRNHNEGRGVQRLEYEVYEPLAVKEGERILEEAAQRYEILAARCEHRTGPVSLGEPAVWVGVTAAHRDAAFAACRYIIDEVKARLPIWKKEYYADGDSGWVNCARRGRGAGVDEAVTARSED